MGELASSRSRSPWTPWIVALVWAAFAMALRAWWLSVQPAVPAWDGAIYHRTAERIARGMGFVDTWNNQPPYKPTAFYPVGYPALLGGAYALFGPHHWVAGMLNVLAGGVSTLFTVRFAQRAFGRAAGHLAGALYACAPGAVIYTSAFMTEPVSAALLCGALASGLHHARTARTGSAVLTGVLLGLGGLVRPPALLVAPVLALVCTPKAQWRAMLRTLTLVGLACCAVVLPWTVRNCVQLDGCALVSVNGGSNLWIGADPQADGGYRGLRAGEGCDHVHGEVAKDRCYGALARERIRRDPRAWLALAPRKLFQLLGHEPTPVSYLQAATQGRAFAGREATLYEWLTRYHSLTLALALLALVPRGLPRFGARTRVVFACSTLVLALVAVHVVFFGVDRYHFVFTPLVCALAGGAFRWSHARSE
jgi:4-amino-4-deoxy-L-arabinose transferase-like glycosyltransferase